jgi:hypothetical protein
MILQQKQKIIQKFVDERLSELKMSDRMYFPLEYMPEEMIDKSRENQDDWIPWKPIKSTVADEDLNEIEGIIGKKFPESFKIFLKYKHFYELNISTVYGYISFFRHPVDDWKKQYFYHDIEKVYLRNGYLPFADYLDCGFLCFDSNIQTEDNEYPIVLINHEEIFNSPISVDLYSNNFVEMIEKK